MRILIVDDDQLLGHMLAEQLRRHEPPFLADAVTTAEAARRKVTESAAAFDVMLIDQQLEGSDVDGVTLMQELRLFSRQSDFVIFTGYDDTDTGIHAFEAGAYRYLVKPFDLRELVLTLRGLAQTRQVRRERNWLQILAETAAEMQRYSTVAGVADAITDGALRLGFERIRLWRMEDNEGEPELLGVRQTGHSGIEDFEQLWVPLAEFPYFQRAWESRSPVSYIGQSLGSGELDRRYPNDFQPPQGEWVVLPLVADDKITGMLSLDNVTRPQTFGAEQLDLLRIFSAQCAAALYRAYKEEEFKTLSEIGRRITQKAATGELDDLLTSVYEQVNQLMSATNMIIALVDPDSTKLYFRLHYEGGLPQPRTWRGQDSGLIGHLIQNYQSLWLPDGREEGFRNDKRVPDCGTMSQCWLGATLRMEGHKAIGAIVVQDYIEPRKFSKRHERLLTALCTQIAGAIHLANEREREQMRRHRSEYLNITMARLRDLLEENENWFWHLVLKFATDECGLHFNRAMIFLADGESGLPMRGRLGVGHLSADDASRFWEIIVTRNAYRMGEPCNLDAFIDHLRSRKVNEPSQIERRIKDWSINVDGELLTQLRDSGKAVYLPVGRLMKNLPSEYAFSFRDVSLDSCVVAPLFHDEQLLGVLIADNVLSGEPVPQSALVDLEILLKEAVAAWKVWSAQQQELTLADRQRLDTLRQQVIEFMHQEKDLKSVLNLICGEVKDLFSADSVVLYPLTADGSSYQADQIAYAGVDEIVLRKVTSIRPRQHGLNAYIKRTGEVVVADVAASPLRFDGVPLRDHGFILDNQVQSLIGLAIRSPRTMDPLGILYINYRDKRALRQRNDRLAVEVASVASLAISMVYGSEEMVDRRRSQELNRLRYVLEAALSPDADEDKVIGALLANTRELLPKAERVELLVTGSGNPTDAERNREWYLYQNKPGEAPLVSSFDVSGDQLIQYLLEYGQAIDSTSQQLPVGLRAHLKAIDMASVIAAPVYHNKHIVGILRASATELGVFSNRDLSQFAELASAAGLVIGSQRRRKGLLSSVLEAAEEVVRPSSLQDVLRKVVDSSFSAAPDLDCVTVWYKQHGSNELVAGPARGLMKTKPREGETAQSTLVWMVMGRKMPIWASLARDNELLKASDFVLDERIKSTAAFPLRVEDSSVGVLFFNYRSQHEFTAEEQEALPIFAAIAAAAIQDAQLSQVAERGKERLEAALTVAKAAGDNWERQKVLPAILTALREHFSTYGTEPSPYLLTYNAEMRVLELPEEVREFYPPALEDHGLLQIPLDAPRIAAKVARKCLDTERGVIFNIPDVSSLEYYDPPDPTTRAELCAGLWRNGRLRGTLVLTSSKIGAFSKEDEDLFALVAEQVAAAIERADGIAEKRVDDYLTGATAWASDLAHDINVDVGYIRNRAYWLRERDPRLSDQGKQWAREIDERAGALATKARDEGSERSKVSVDLGQFLEKKTREWQARACPSTKITYEWGSDPIFVPVYPEQVWRSVKHLLRNAIEAMDYRGHIWLRLNESEPDIVELQVENSGKDISSEARQRIFREPYSSKVGDQKGGMGLLIAKKLIEHMGGSIRLLPPRPGRGPIFAVTLPCTDEPGDAS